MELIKITKAKIRRETGKSMPFVKHMMIVMILAHRIVKQNIAMFRNNVTHLPQLM